MSLGSQSLKEISGTETRMAKRPRKVCNEDDRVLILLPIADEPLGIAYCGLYTTDRKVSNVDYITSCRVHTCSARRKNNRMHHLNMLKSYYDRIDDIKQY